VLTVRDTGAGIPPENLKMVFDPFFTTKDVGQGSGLGLSQVYGFVKQSGGHIELDSKLGQGTEVRIYLPRADVDVGAAENKASKTSLPLGAGERVLVIEDDPDVREVTLSILDGLGYETLDGGDGSNVDEILGDRTGAIDLVLTDVVLPGGLTGPDVAEGIRRQFSETKILLMTGYAEGDVILSDGRHLKFPLINKPFEVADLANKLRQTLDGDMFDFAGGRY
jgi:CheY-like chemotaxis protein